MNIQLTITIGSQKHNVFLPSEFYRPFAVPKHLHKHKYPEIHLVTGGNAAFNIDGRFRSVNSGTMLVIPPDMYHSYLNKEDGAYRASFQIDCNIDKFAEYSISPDTISGFFREVEECETTEDYTRLSAYITLFVSYIYPKKEFIVQPLEDHGFLIHEFLSRYYYEDLRLHDLASTLHLSDRQAERLVIEHSGKSFREALADTRINIAKQLLKHSDMSLTEIAEYVGYKSYAGFWKAMKKHDTKVNE